MTVKEYCERFRDREGWYDICIEPDNRERIAEVIEAAERVRVWREALRSTGNDEAATQATHEYDRACRAMDTALDALLAEPKP